MATETGSTSLRFARPLLASALGACVLSLIGCMPPVEPVAAQGMSCAEDQLEAEQMGMTQVVSGCGKKDVFLFDGNQGTWVSLRDRASFEMKCEKNEVEIKVLDSMSFGVAGCERRAVYKTDWMHGFVMSSAMDPENHSVGASKAAPSEE